MDLKEIKAFISAWGVQVSTCRKNEFIQLAKAIGFMDILTDSDFENESIDEFFSRRLTLSADKKFGFLQMASLSNDLSQLPSFGLMDI